MRSLVLSVVLLVHIIKVLDAEQQQLSPVESQTNSAPVRFSEPQGSQRIQHTVPPLPVPPPLDADTTNLLEIGPFQNLHHPSFRRRSTGNLGVGKFLPPDYQKRYKPDDLVMDDCFQGPTYINMVLDDIQVTDMAPALNDIVIIKSKSLEKAKKLQGSTGGGWVDEMEHLLGKRGMVTDKDHEGNPTIFGFKWHPSLVKREHKPIRVNDIISIKNTTAIEGKRLQGNVGGGWVDEMEHLLGKRGMVTAKDQQGNPTVFGFKWSPGLVGKELGKMYTKSKCKLCEQIYRNSLIWNWQWHYSALCNLVPPNLQVACKVMACKLSNCAEFLSASCHVKDTVVTPCPAKYVCWNCLGIPQKQVVGCFDGL